MIGDLKVARSTLKKQRRFTGFGVPSQFGEYVLIDAEWLKEVLDELAEIREGDGVTVKFANDEKGRPTDA